MKYLLGVLGGIFLLPITSLALPASELDNSGFIPSNIWYSQEPIFAGDKVRIYTIVFNGSGYDLSGAVEFYDNGSLIGSTSFALSSGGRVRDLWVDWVAKEGKHTITAKIAKTVADQSGKKVPVILENIETGKSERTIEYDTDGDDIGNTEDADDDGDGVSDVDEIKNSTNPLVKDSDGDGVSDKQEILDKERKEEKDRADALLAQASTTSVFQKIENTLETTGEALPPPVKSLVASSTNMLENFRIEQGYAFQLKKDSVLREIRTPKTATSTSVVATTTTDMQKPIEGVYTTEKPLAYIKVGVYGMLQYIFQWKVLFYSLLFVATFFALRLALRRFMNRG